MENSRGANLASENMNYNVLLVVAEKKGLSNCDSGCSFNTSPWIYSFMQNIKSDGNMVFMGNIKVVCVGAINLGFINAIEIKIEEARHANNFSGAYSLDDI